MKVLGEKLRVLRENAGLSIDDVYKKTKIAQSTIKSIETGNISRLPAKSFLRGFVVTYAKSIGAPIEEIVNEFDKEYAELFPVIAKESVATTDDPENRQNILWFNTSGKISLALGLSLIVGLIYLIYYFSNQITDSIETSKTDLTEIANSTPLTSENLPLAADTKTNSESLGPEKENLVTAITGQQTNITNPQAATDIEKKAVDTAEINATAANANSTTSPESVKTELKEKPLPKVILPIKHKFMFKADETVSLKITPEGEPPKLISVLAGKERVFETSKAVVIDISEGGIMAITHNGEDLGVAGSKGQPLRLVYP